jgi:hypothetical protein
MIEFTIRFGDDSSLDFEPFREAPDLEFMLPPTARIGRDDDNVHLAPIPVHNVFNAVVFSLWLAAKNGISLNDAFLIYLVHDMFKSLLQMIPGSRPGSVRDWPHQGISKFGEVEADLQKVFNDFASSYSIVKSHRGPKWIEAVEYERDLSIETEVETVGLAIRLQPALSNIFAIGHLKALFIRAYVKALEVEYPSVFAKFDEVIYCYEFIDPAHVTGDVQRDVKDLCRQSKVSFTGGKLRIETYIGANSALLPGEQTKIRLPFWMLLTLQEDPTSVIFPVPKLPSGLPNNGFVRRVRREFTRHIESLLQSVPSRGRDWATKLTQLVANIDDTIHVDSGDLETVRGARDPVAMDTQCGLCGSSIPSTFACSPVRDLGWKPSRYTDWHIGDLESVCLLCAISHFKVPPAFAVAQKLVKQRQLVYFSISTPHATGESLLDDTPKADLLPFFSANITPKLVISSLESLVTLNLVGALFLHSAVSEAKVLRNGEKDLWLEQVAELSPFSFVGQVGKAASKRALPEFLSTMHSSFARPVLITDPLMFIQVEVPFHTLACVMGAKSGRHYELKFKPLLVSNTAGTLPIVHDGYHFIDQSAANAIREIQRFVDRFRSPKVKDRLKVTSIATKPEEFVNVMVELGGFNYGTIHERLAELAKNNDTFAYLEHLQALVTQYPIIREIWRRR